MSDEKRQTRLLPFRLRRAAHAADARDNSAGVGEFSDDAELSGLLRVWDAPEPSAGARERLLAEFRATARRVPFWRRALTAELRVPLPVAACAALVLLASLLALVSHTQTAATAETHAAPVEVRAAESAPAVKIVEVPVERERIVTRVVYVEKNSRPAEAQQLAATQRSTSTQRSGTVRQTTTARAVVAQPSAEPTSYFTRVDMADFQPADEMKIRIVKRGKTDEK